MRWCEQNVRSWSLNKSNVSELGWAESEDQSLNELELNEINDPNMR